MNSGREWKVRKVLVSVLTLVGLYALWRWLLRPPEKEATTVSKIERETHMDRMTHEELLQSVNAGELEVSQLTQAVEAYGEEPHKGGRQGQLEFQLRSIIAKQENLHEEAPYTPPGWTRKEEEVSLDDKFKTFSSSEAGEEEEAGRIEFCEPVREDEVSKGITDGVEEQPAPQLVDADTLLAALRNEREASNTLYAPSEELKSFIAQTQSWVNAHNERDDKQDERLDEHKKHLEHHDGVVEDFEGRLEGTRDLVEKNARQIGELNTRTQDARQMAERALRLAQDATVEVFTRNLFRIPLIAAIIAGVLAFIVIGIPLFVENPELDMGRETYLWFPPVVFFVLIFCVILAVHLIRARSEATEDTEEISRSEGK